jgi:hypothetical protein
MAICHCDRLLVMLVGVLFLCSLPSHVEAICGETCPDNEYCIKHEDGAHCQHCWGVPKICREYPEPPPPQPPPPPPESICHKPCSDNAYCISHPDGSSCQHCWGEPKICREYPEPSVCHQNCSGDDFCRSGKDGASCQHCWGGPKICRENPEPPPPQPPSPTPAPSGESGVIFMYDYFDDRSIASNQLVIVPDVEYIWGGVNGTPSASIGHQLGGRTSAKITPSEFTYSIVYNLLQYNDYVHVDEVKDEPNCRCDDCAGVVNQLCSHSAALCGRVLFFFRYPVGDSFGPRADLLVLAAQGKVKRIMFETYPGAKSPETWLNAVTIANRGSSDFSIWSSLYKTYGPSVVPVVGLGNRVGHNGAMNSCTLDMQYLASIFSLIHQYGPWWTGVAIYGASEVDNHCAPSYTVQTVIERLHGYFSWWPH